ncbi:serine hydrolase domain-containing protein [Neobacillus terrae]|uniref:serine hydrolase domain-containing protein n=1 Tax=Neobacillus terrae TaxID=3034837 RepID=UPI00140AAAB3|nr:serine hydrolase domain-containing protein [Neobacillus terrae]NHM30217.1 beta-lactamase family protein [Neobacillus terrae]
MSVLLENINRIIHDSMKNNGIPGAAVAVIKENKVILSQGFGRTNVEDWGTPISSNTLFRIASVSKLFTGTLMMRLVEKGLIDLDKPVQYYVHWFTATDPELSKLITIRMLLTHSSGLPTGGGLSFHHDEEGLFRYMKEIVPTLPILFHPGTAYSYGNHGPNIAGFVAEQVTKKKFDVLMQEFLFDPLEMNQTTYNPLKAMTYPLALPHHRGNAGNPTISHQFLDNAASYPSYYAFSAIDDLCKFAMMHLQNGVYENKQVLSPSSINEMRKEQNNWYTLTEAGCGINFFRETKDGVERFWHYGQYSNQYSSQFILVPEKGIAVIALANGEDIFQAGYEIVDELLKEESKASINREKPEIVYHPDWKAFEGSYLHSYYGLIDIYSLNSKMYIKHNGQQFELSPYSNDTCFAKNDEGNIIYTVGFPVPAEGQTIKCVMVNSNACPEFIQDYIPNHLEWENWTGIYSDGRDSYDVSVHEDTLIIKDHQTNKELIGQAIKGNQFLTKEYGLVSFIDVNGITTLEFGYAWRYPKQS